MLIAELGPAWRVYFYGYRWQGPKTALRPLSTWLNYILSRNIFVAIFRTTKHCTTKGVGRKISRGRNGKSKTEISKKQHH